MPLASADRRARALLLGAAFTVAAAGLAYELIAAAVSSYFLGDAFTQYSLAIGVFMSAMGLGSHLARYVESRLIPTFIDVEIAVGVVGGLSSILMFALNAYLPSLFSIGFYALCISIGVLVGIEIPLLVRIGRAGSGWSDALSDTLAFDYVGALAASVLLPLVILPHLGLARASLAFGLANLLVAAATTTLLDRPARARWLIGASGVLLAVAMVGSTRLVGFLEDRLYADDVIFATSTPYQRIVLTRWRGDVRLYLDGHLQFSTVDEARYHEALVIPAMEAAGRPARVLVLGGGDGMATRVVLEYPGVERVDLVDLDPTMTTLFSTRADLRALNEDALNDPRVRVHNVDAGAFLETSTEGWDVILADFVDPHAETLARLYSTSFYALVQRRLREHGVFTTQATSPFYAPEAFWCVARTLEDAATGPIPRRVTPYRVNVPSFGEWGFVALAPADLDFTALSPSIPTRHLDRDALNALFAFGAEARPQVEVNRLDQPVLAGYYRRGWQRFNE